MSSHWSPLGIKRKRLLVALAASLVLLVGLLLGVKRWVGSEAMQQRVRAKLVARLGEGVELGDAFSVSWLGTLSFGPMVVRGSEATAAPVISAKRVSVRPRWEALVRGSVEPGVVRFEEITVNAGENGAALRDLLASSRGARHSETGAARGSAQLPELQFETALIKALVRGQQLEVALDSGRLVVHRDEATGETHLEGSLSPAGGGRARLLAALTADGIRTAEVSFDDGVPLQGLLPVEGALNGSLRLTTHQHHRAGTLEWTLSANELVITNARLASEPVGPMRVSSRGTVKWDVEQGTIALEPLELSFGAAEEMKLSATAAYSLSTEQISIDARSVDLDYQRAVASLPAALAPGELSVEVSGPMSVMLDLNGPLRRPSDWVLNVKLDLTALRQAARGRAHALARQFVFNTTLFDGRPREITVGSSNPSFVPLSEIPRSLIRAVLLSEDSMFMTHQGFDFFEMKNDLFAQSENGETVIRGASTMTQQLAKNLYLSREKTYARKIREAFLTLALEAAVPKERLLEIYLNIIEWGPGLNGIGEAARHYFGKSASALTVREAAYLATIIPSPVRYYGFFTKGELPEVWQRRVADLLTKMHSAGDLTDEELALALEAPLRFARPE